MSLISAMAQAEKVIDNSHFLQSSLREKLIEHLFVGEMLRCLWRKHRRDIEVLKAEVDYAGYDLVLECNNVMRHVQLKSSYQSAKTQSVNVHINLANKSCGCVIWISFDADTLQLGPFWWFGAPPKQPLPSLGDQIARQPRGDRTGKKAERPFLRVVRKSKFQQLQTMDDVVRALFGEL